MVEKETLSENWDPGTLGMTQGVGRCRNEEDSPCKSGMAQGKLCQVVLRQEPGRTRNPETTKGQEETVERPGIQRWLKGRPETAATQ
jgi:hypothetical protein